MAYLPWLIALLAADMVLAVAALIRGRWTAVLRMLAIGSNLISVALCWLMLAGPSLAAWPELNLIFDIIVAVVLVVNVVEAAQHVWRLWRNRS